MKICARCKVFKDDSEFYTYRRKGRVTLYARCKPCHIIDKGDKVTPEARRKYRNDHRRNVQLKIDKIKSVPCMDCKETFPPYVMDFDHVRGEKFKNIAKMTGKNSWLEVLAEIEKCDIVCSNCHRIRTHTRK